MGKRTVFVMLISSVLIFATVILISFITHKIQLSKEASSFIPMGEMVEVNGHQMHVYTEGSGEETLVFMSGGGTSSPVLDFKSLYTLLSDQYKIVVIEKLGYGFSEITDTDRDIARILAETRAALNGLGINEPYILVPHSMSGIEALKWAQIYPEEIKAIIGLDMAVPAAYDKLDINMFFVHLGAFAAKTGITRWVPSLSESDAIKYGTLTDEEKELAKVIFNRRTSTENMINEIKSIQANAEKVSAGVKVNHPMLLLSSNGEETGFVAEEWVKIQEDFTNESAARKLIALDAAHYIHAIDYQRVAEEIQLFIEQMNGGPHNEK